MSEKVMSGIVVLIIVVLCFMVLVFFWQRKRGQLRLLGKEAKGWDAINLRTLRRLIAGVIVLFVWLFCLGGLNVAGPSDFPLWPTDWLIRWADSIRGLVLIEILLLLAVGLLVFADGPNTPLPAMIKDGQTKKDANSRHLRLTVAELPAEDANRILKLFRFRARRGRQAHLEFVLKVADKEIDVNDVTWWQLKRILAELEQSIKEERPPSAHDAAAWNDAARHEAGHAVVHRALGTEVFFVEVLGTLDGCTGPRAYFPVQNSYTETWAHQQWVDLVTALAGEVCEDMDKTKDFSVGTEHDWRGALRPALLLHTRHATIDGRIPGSVGAWLHSASDEAQRIILKNKATIEEVVQQLESSKDGNGYSGLGLVQLRTLLADVETEELARISTVKASELQRMQKPARNWRNLGD